MAASSPPSDVDLVAVTSKTHLITDTASIASLNDTSSIEHVHVHSAYDNASFLSRLTFHWLNMLVWKGYKRPLELEDLDLPSNKFKAKLWTQKFEEAICEEQVRVATVNDSARRRGILRPPAQFRLWRVIWQVIGRHWASMGLLKFLSDFATLMTPTLLALLIMEVKLARGVVASIGDPNIDFFAVYISSDNFWNAFGYSIALFSLACISSLSLNWYFQEVMLDGLLIRTGLNGAIYEKLFRLQSNKIVAKNSGPLDVVNLVSVDTSRLELLAGYLHYVWSGVLQILIISVLLILKLGWPAIVGLSLMVLSIPYHRFTIRQLSLLRRANVGISDSRVTLLQETFQSIKFLKVYALEKWISSRLFKFRDVELSNIKRMQIYRAFLDAIAFGIPLFSSIITFGVYAWVNNGNLDSETIFPALTLFNLARVPLLLFPRVVNMLVDALVSVRRLETYFMAHESVFIPGLCVDPNVVIDISNANLKHIDTNVVADPSGDGQVVDNAATLHNINLRICRGDFVVIIGAVGTGKTSLLRSLVGELVLLSGQISFKPELTIGYCGQQSWIQNATVRDNILFGLPFDEKRYGDVIESCCLEDDLRSFTRGDATEIGEKGVTLSGGQKQRIALARMVYSGKEVWLMDDPLSAVDAHVGQKLFKNVLRKNSNHPHITRVLVTHHLWVCSKADWIICMENGTIAYQGTYQNLLNNERFSYLLESIQANNGQQEDESAEDPSQSLITQESNLNSAKNANDHPADPLSGSLKSATLMQAEERALGAVRTSIYSNYIRLSGGSIYLIFVLVAILFTQTARLLTDLWLAHETSADASAKSSMAIFLAIYCTLGVLQSVGSIIYSLVFSYGALRSAQLLFESAFMAVFYSPLVFFETTPLGRILNRFTKDTDAIDNVLNETLRSFATTISICLFTLFLMAYVTPVIIPVLVLLIGLYVWIQHVYRSSSRELKRLEALTKSPWLAHFTESLTGISTIRAALMSSLFSDRYQNLADNSNFPSFYQISIQRWLALRLEFIGNSILVVVAIGSLLFRVEPGMAGLLISYSLALNGFLNWAVRQAAETEVQMNAVERVIYYGNLKSEECILSFDSEKGGDVEKKRPLLQYNYPYALEFCNVSLRYRPDLPLSLKNVSFKIKPGERVGIVGRTGSGKSTILSALFRLCDIEKSSLPDNHEQESSNSLQPSGIYMFGASTSALDLATLRGRYLTMILQDSYFFTDSLRVNLDPLHRHSDLEIWKVLEKVSLKKVVQGLEDGLDTKMSSNGEPWSLGQRQLLALARALLKMKPAENLAEGSCPCAGAILVMDEATANVDMATDSVLQQTLSEYFPKKDTVVTDVKQRDDCTTPPWTILTIAHRISTIMDYDRILVMNQGQLVEEGSPHNLLSNPSSLFYSLVNTSHQV